MNQNVKIAKALIKLAKEMVAFQHDDVTIGPFRIHVERMALGNMRYPGDFICVYGQYKDMIHIKDSLKALGFRYDRDYGWHCFWNKVNWNDVENVCNEYVNQLNQNTAPVPVNMDEVFEKDLILDSLGETFEKDFHIYGHYRSTTYKKKFIFRDNDGNKYSCFLTNKSRGWKCDKDFWDAEGKEFAEDLDQKVGKTFHVVGRPIKITKTTTNYEVYFDMQR